MLCALAAVPAFFVLDQDPRPAEPPAPSLAVLAPLVGTDWVATFPGGKVTDTQRYEWVFGDRFVRNRHQVRTEDGKTVNEGEAIYAFDQRERRIVWWYWNTTGGYVTGTLTRDAGGALVADGENHGAADQLDRKRQVIRIGDGEWTVTGAQQKGGEWVEQPARTYRPAD
jgi:hypothetical protein